MFVELSLFFSRSMRKAITSAGVCSGSSSGPLPIFSFSRAAMPAGVLGMRICSSMMNRINCAYGAMSQDPKTKTAMQKEHLCEGQGESALDEVTGKIREVVRPHLHENVIASSEREREREAKSTQTSR